MFYGRCVSTRVTGRYVATRAVLTTNAGEIYGDERRFVVAGAAVGVGQVSHVRVLSLISRLRPHTWSPGRECSRRCTSRIHGSELFAKIIQAIDDLGLQPAHTGIEGGVSPFSRLVMSRLSTSSRSSRFPCPQPRSNFGMRPHEAGRFVRFGRPANAGGRCLAPTGHRSFGMAPQGQ
jgi:hypothetical protein